MAGEKISRYSVATCTGCFSPDAEDSGVSVHWEIYDTRKRVFLKGNYKSEKACEKAVAALNTKEKKSSKPNKAKRPVMRTVLLPKPDDELRPWVLDFKEKVTCMERTAPYAENGFITREGWFFQCDPYGHDKWANAIAGVLSRYLIEKAGWVAVWDFKSMFDKSGRTTPRFRWDTDTGLTSAQQMTMMKWCECRNLTLKQACGYFFYCFDMNLE